MSSFANVSLDLESYRLDDIAKLFRIDDARNITRADLKSARKIVMMTHPDKSGLDKEYFQFFAKAYERLSSVADFANRSSQTEACYRERHRRIDVENNEALRPALLRAGVITEDNTKGRKWNVWKEKFDAWFEQHGELASSANGYDEFMRSTADLLPEDATEAQAKAFMESRKTMLGALVKHESVAGIDGWSTFGGRGTSVTGGSHAGEDLLKAYTETVVPVTDEDFKNRRKYSSVDEYRRDRYYDQNVSEATYQEANAKHTQEKVNQEKKELDEYYDYLKSVETGRESVAKFQAGILRLCGDQSN